MSTEDTHIEFDRYAPSYAELLDDPLRSKFALDPLHFHRRKDLVLDRVLKQAGRSSRTLRWLDVGCGRGELLKLAGSRFREATGCDPSAGMLSASSSLKVYQQPSLEQLPFGDGSVDLVTAVCVFHHVHGFARTALAQEIKRILAPRGICCVMEHNPWNPVTRTIVRRCPVDADAELLSATTTKNLFRAAGFRPLGTDYFLYLPERWFNRFGRVERVLRNLPLGGQYAFVAIAPS